MPANEKTKNELMKEYFCAVIPEDVITTNKTGKLFLNGVEMTEGEGRSLRTEAEYFMKSKLASILWNSLYDQAQKIMFEKAENFDDMRNGKMMLYNISVQKNIVKLLASQNFDKKSGPVYTAPKKKL